MAGQMPAEGIVTNVPFMKLAGLRLLESVPFFVRSAHTELWNTLERTSCMLEGPPGSGKSTAVWLWLLYRVRRIGRPSLWMHFHKIAGHIIVCISRTADGSLSFEQIFETDAFNTSVDYVAKTIDVCVIDGVTSANMSVASRSWRVFGLDLNHYVNCRMIWVTSQQCVVGGEHLKQVNMKRRMYFSWTEEEILAHAAMLSPEDQVVFRDDVLAGMEPTRRVPNANINFNQAVQIKLFFCGCSARWMYGMTMEDALEDIHTHIGAINNAQVIQSGLSGSRTKVAVNHIIAMSESQNRERPALFKIASSFIMEQLSENVGLEAIKVMYSSHWVQHNPSVHGFVFEWDILTRLDKLKQLHLTDINGHASTWTVVKTVRLAEFARTGMTEERLLVCPEKWNHPEYDGLYIYRDTQGTHLVAWNASAAMKHTGKVSTLLTMLEEFSQREVDAINFQSVRFLFLVPPERLAGFNLPSGSDCTAAKKHLAAWPSFTGFEVYSTTRCTEM